MSNQKNDLSFLKEYSTLVDKVKQGLASRLSLRNAIIQAVNYCINNDVMKQFLLDNEKEMLNMLALHGILMMLKLPGRKRLVAKREIQQSKKLLLKCCVKINQ